MKRGKRFNTASEKIDGAQKYSPEDAIALVRETATAKFDETIEMHILTGLDPRHAEQQIRDSTVLPHGLGKEMRIAVFTEGEAAREATEAGADIVGGDDLIQQVQDGFTEFDTAIATREMMGKVGRLGRVLGPRGLMPNPRSGTVVAPEDIARTVTEAKRGRVEFRLDRLANIHVPLGKASFEEEKLRDNMATFIEAINEARPETKGAFIRSVTITSTMGPAIGIDVNQAMALKPA
ncbi:MAG: 50S ribosomal protein L1 [Dehalococcoidia bacterium]|nr:50S ribosomal protein L1 [Dehalococcoidia bacterium]